MRLERNSIGLCLVYLLFRHWLKVHLLNNQNRVDDLKITISGATGFIGNRLCRALLQEGHSLHILSRNSKNELPIGTQLSVWKNPINDLPPEESLREADAVIHLAGEPVAQRWTNKSKQAIRESRVAGTRNLVKTISKLPRKPRILICSSAIGYYGTRGDEILTEDSTPGKGFLSEVCMAWEKEAEAVAVLGMRVVQLRTGVVLDRRGGALQRMLPPFRLGLGGRLGDGKQWMSWIHLEDLIGLFRFALQNSVQGALNGVAPNPVTNAEFTSALANALKRPAFFPVPKLALRFLFGEMSDILLDSQRVVPNKSQAAGYRFGFPHLKQAFESLLKN